MEEERERGKGKRKIEEKTIGENLVRDFEHLTLSENVLTLSILLILVGNDTQYWD